MYIHIYIYTYIYIYTMYIHIIYIYNVYIFIIYIYRVHNDNAFLGSLQFRLLLGPMIWMSPSCGVWISVFSSGEFPVPPNFDQVREDEMVPHSRICQHLAGD